MGCKFQKRATYQGLGKNHQVIPCPVCFHFHLQKLLAPQGCPKSYFVATSFQTQECYRDGIHMWIKLEDSGGWSGAQTVGCFCFAMS